MASNRQNNKRKVGSSINPFYNKSHTVTILTVANIGEILSNSYEKMFEVIFRIDGTDLSLRPAMTLCNKIILKTIPDAIYVPIECIRVDADSVQYVYKKNKTQQIVIL